MKLSRLLPLAGLAFAAAAHAFEFKSIGAAPAVMYDAPSAKGVKRFVAPRGMPVEVVLSYGEWSKVRDVKGDLAWLETKHLTPKRTLVARAPNLRVRAAADDAAQTVFSVDKGVLLDLAETPSSGWAKVTHADGQSGYVKVGEVWGL